MANRNAQKAGVASPQRSDDAELEELQLNESLPLLMRQTHRQLVRALQGALEKRGITASQWYFLRVLWEEEGLTQAELSARVGIKTPTTVAALNSLERIEFIERRAHLSDKRKYCIYLTRKGHQLKRELIPIARAVHANALRGISEVKIEIVREVLSAIQANIG